MVTTALFVEILVIGALAEIWIALLFASALTLHIPSSSVASSAGDVAALLALPLLALTYSLGWIVNFLAERAFKPSQRKLRDHLFQEAGIDYETARALVFQEGAEQAVEELRFGRHIVRLSRSSCLQLPLIALALLFHVNQAPLPISGVAVLLMALGLAAFFQWLTRYRSYYRRLLALYKLLAEERLAQRPREA